MLTMLQMTGPDQRMDCQSLFDTAVNVLPERCATCGFPEVDFLPEKYLLKSGTGSPAGLLLAEVGNLFVRPRILKILEIVAPGAWSVRPTFHFKGGEPTEWLLLVPPIFEDGWIPFHSIPRCTDCGEARTAHPGSQCLFKGLGVSPGHIAKSRQWYSSERVPEKEGKKWTRNAYFFGRNLYFSTRLSILLFKKLKTKSLCPTMLNYGAPTAEDHAWVSENFAKLEIAGLTSALPAKAKSKTKGAVKTSTWFEKYIAKQKDGDTFDAGALERAHAVSLPGSFRIFAATVGRKTYSDIDGEEGFEATIANPSPEDVAAHSGEISEDQGGPLTLFPFAVTGHGDEFLFNLAETPEDPPVYHYDHEMGCYQPYAANFAECIRRWAEK